MIAEWIIRLVKFGRSCAVVGFLIFLLISPQIMSCGPSAPGPPMMMREDRASQPQLTRKFGSQEGMRPPEFNTEQYDHLPETGFKSVQSAPLSTFSVDLDTASYANLRRFLNNKQLPPKDAVRIEEMINYFSYRYPRPEGDTPFSLYTELSACPWKKNHQLLHVGLQGKHIETKNLPAMNLVFLLDVSGSMQSPDKLPLLKKGFKMLTEQLRSRDRVAIAVYAGASGLVLPSTPGDRKARITQAINELEAGGSTAGAAGIELAYQVAKDNFIEDGNNRVILATDGDFNVGPSSQGQLVRMIEKKRQQGIFLTVLGFGTGNLKDSTMEQLADKGNGNYAYIDGPLEAKKVLVREMGGTLMAIAKDVKLQIEFNPAKVKAYRLIGYENRRLENEDFHDEQKDAGEIGAGHTVTALYELIPAGSDEKVPGVDDLKYQENRVREAARTSSELLTLKLRYKPPRSDTSRLMSHPLEDAAVALDQSSEDFRFSAAVAGLGLLLRDSDFKGDLGYQQVIDLAKGAKGEDPEGYRAEFIRLAEQAELLAP